MTGAFVTNTLASGLVLLKLLNGNGWSKPGSLSLTSVQLLRITTAVSFTLNALRVPVLGICVWACNRITHRLEARLADPVSRTDQNGSLTWTGAPWQ